MGSENTDHNSIVVWQLTGVLSCWASFPPLNPHLRLSGRLRLPCCLCLSCGLSLLLRFRRLR